MKFGVERRGHVPPLPPGSYATELGLGLIFDFLLHCPPPLSRLYLLTAADHSSPLVCGLVFVKSRPQQLGDFSLQPYHSKGKRMVLYEFEIQAILFIRAIR